jgi:uncharacterized SAM-binding protein YcdF (DUF218 family)
LIVVGGLWFCRRIVLEQAASLLIVNQPAVGCEYILILEADCWESRWFNAAAAYYRERPSRRIVLVEPRPGPVVLLGVVASYEERCRAALEKRGVPREAVILIPGKAEDIWAQARSVQQWLADRPTHRIAVFSGGFSSRFHRLVFDRLLDAEDAARASVCTLSSPNCNESNWWETRSGWKTFLFAGLRLAYAWLAGEGSPPEAERTPDECDRTVRLMLAEDGP